MSMFDRETSLQPMSPMESPNFIYTEIVQKRLIIMQGHSWLTLFTKALGYFVIGSVAMSQIPQIFKILRQRNAAGVSFLSMILMLEASSFRVAYSVLKEHPINSWGENLVFMIENMILVCLVIRYNKNALATLFFVAFYDIAMIALMSSVVPIEVLRFLNTISIPATSASRMIQIYTNKKNKGSGQLSATSSFLCIFQSCGRLTTSIVLTQEWILILTLVHNMVLNVILTFQVLYYRRRSRSS